MEKSAKYIIYHEDRNFNYKWRLKVLSIPITMPCPEADLSNSGEYSTTIVTGG
jgi:hypothetical protein